MVELVSNVANVDDGDVTVVLLRGVEAQEIKRIGEFCSRIDVKYLKKAIENRKYEGKSKQSLVLDDGVKKIILVGMPDEINKAEMLELGAVIASKLKKDFSATIFMPKNAADYAGDLALGMELALYSFDKYMTKKKDEDFNKLEKVCLIIEKGEVDMKKMAEAKALAIGVRYARDLGNEPANYLTPKVLADDIKRLEYLGLEVEIIPAKKLKEKGFNLLLEVGKASVNEPCVVVAKWMGDKKRKDFDLVLVGKGVTHDAGGTNIKTANNLLDMKMDMSGAGAVAAVLKVLALEKKKINVAAVLGLVENVLAGNAYKPDDVIVSGSGQTIEVINTDAEGRLVLADCLWYAGEKLQAKKIVDVATLTGVTAYVFDGEFAAVLGNDEKLNHDLIMAGKNSGEKLWELPMDETYRKMLKSNIADMKNLGGKMAGASTAAEFLNNFVKEGITWAHLDIAGCEVVHENKNLTPKGATGFGVRLLHEYIKKFI